MTQQIYCKKCTDDYDSRKQSYEGEGQKIVRGHSKANCVCDHCDDRINEKDECGAISFYKNGLY